MAWFRLHPRSAPWTGCADMADYGHTRITATGPLPDRAALLAHVRATARDGFDFTLSGLVAPDPVFDDLVRWAELTATEDAVVLSVSIRWGLDALGIARLLATRFPALRIVGVFLAEQDLFAFNALAFADGKLAYDAHFIDEFSFVVPGPARYHSSFFERTPDRSQAAREHLTPAALESLAAQPPAVAGWRRSEEDAPGCVTYCQPGTADTAGCVLVLHGDGLTLLHDLDPYGGYGRAEPLDPATVGARLPELATAIERHRQEYTADLAATRQRVQLAEDDKENIPF